MSLSVETLRGARFGPVDLRVEPGECAAITGASGAGKSVLLRAIADLDPNEGVVRCGILDRSAVAAPHWRSAVRYCAAEAGWWAPTPSAHFPDGTLAQARVAAGRLGLDAELLERPVALLSTGERQRLALVRATLGTPRCLLLDEPTAALDPASTDAVEAMLAEKLAAGTIVVIVTHDAAQAERLARRHYRMADGRLTAA